MALATRCPNCSALFRIVAEQLKSRGGMVRCGSCRHVFNAIGCLDYVDPPPTAPERPPALPTRGDATEQGAAPTPGSVVTAVPAPAPMAASDGPDTADFAIDAADNGPLTIMATDMTTDLRIVDVLTAAPATAPHEAAPTIADDAVGENAIEEDTRAQVRELDEPAFLRARDARAGRGGRFLLASGAAVLAILLAAQLSLLFRTQLVVHVPQARPLLAALCQPLACAAQWPMRPEFLAVVSSELQAVPGTEALELDVVLRNRADYPMAIPSVELTITNSLNRPVARKVFAPRDFLSMPGDPAGANTPGDNIAAGADLSLRLLFDLPGVNAAGFVAYPFYP